MSFLSSAGFRVGILVVGASALIAYMSMQLSQDKSFINGETRTFWLLTPSADGLIRNGQVKMAGIPVGLITNIALQDGMARVDISVDARVPVRVSAAATLKASGVLGDRHVELDPGDLEDPPLPSGSRITKVRGAGSLATVLDQVSKVADSLKATADSLAIAVQGNGDRNDVVGRILLNVEALTEDMAQVTAANKSQVNRIVDELSSITRSVNEVVVGGGAGGEGFQQGWGRLMSSLERLETASQNLQDITDKVNAGEGSLGRLIHDESTIDEINTAVENVNTLLGGATKMETSLDFGSEYYSGVEQWKTYVGVKIQPGPDRYYLLRAVDDPTGLVHTTETRSTENAGTETVRRTEQTDYSKTKLTALFAKNFYNWTLKGGLFESSGGLGVDYSVWGGRITASLMAFKLDNANLRASLSYQPVRGIFVTGGMNDLLDNSSAFSSYFGAGILLTNDDLKLLLTGSSF